MAITSTYPIIVPKLTDLIVGTQTYTVEDPVLNNPTRNFTVQSIADLVSPTGTANTIAMFSISGLTDSLITQAGSSITVAGNTGITGSLTINNTTTNAGIFMNSSSTGFGGNYIQAKKSDGSEQWLFGGNSGFDDRITLHQANSADIKIKIMSNEAVTIKPNGDVGINVTAPQSKLQVNGGIQMADDTATPSAAKVGTLRYRTASTGANTYASYVDMCMQTGPPWFPTYAWVNIKTNNY